MIFNVVVARWGTGLHWAEFVTALDPRTQQREHLEESLAKESVSLYK